ncbi:4Fe-4S binding protein [Desulfococcaceae bacterium HSG8]|nr:4Fe-4S binding protein [Desulfococcaceae bacterium HSG8]
MIQVITLGLFLLLLLLAFVSESPAAADIFLRLDPILVMITAVSARIFRPAFIPGLVVLLLAPVAGRIFCGYVCPMGTTLDGGDRIFGPVPRKQFRSETLRMVKYLVLIFLMGAAAGGISFVFAASPLSLVTRFYGLVLYPVLGFLSHRAVELLRPVADYLDIRSLAYAQIDVPKFATQFFVLSFFAAIFAMVRFSPRFWCRYLCPSGAILAIFSQKPIIRRRVSEDCTDCGKCVRKCPMNAIPGDSPGLTRSGECIICQTCKGVCPVSAVSFGIEKGLPRIPEPLITGISLSRRGFIYSGVAGAGTALVSLTGLNAPHDKAGEGQVAPPGLIRPPGARPEADFLSRCVRCGECMAACPTNTIQPLWLTAGFTGIFSPSLISRRGVCDPKCNRCGHICPTDAIRNLSKNERIWAKTGTAMIFRQKCLAWEYQKSCMVCDEVCPFNAIEFKREPGNPFAVPHVIEDKCGGCGYCEHFCPVNNQAAIVVTPMGEIRLAGGSYEKEGRGMGLRLQLKTGGYNLPPVEAGGSAPGFEE